ncbi:putative leukotriene A-4 hydrolase [Ancylostoma caninum]|uniref:Putative leukotriene A-4 hydrolase n=1 Tax=Ancylostoma caninum TaxID=29170 RepID=A0A368H1G3_ANCCA|nr:putative leukotriene A-4 hydrolase [Ancylostoma caninum]
MICCVQVLELGAGTGICGLTLAALGADVIITDLPSRLPLILKNYEANRSHCFGSVTVEALDWSCPGTLPDVDLLVLVDCIYYLDSIDPLIKTMTSCNAKEVLCIYEKRDIGEPVIAQNVFLEKIVNFYEVQIVPDSDLHPDYSGCDEIAVIKLIRKYLTGCTVFVYSIWMVYRDPATASNYDQIKVVHYFLDWKVDFSEKKIAGSILMTLKAVTAVDKVVLDAHNLAISSVKINGQDAKFSVEHWTLGDKVVVQTEPLSEGQEVKLEIKYSTAKEATALQFLDKELTADKKAPYLFSQCQAIHARSIMPCMDTPSVKSTYDAQVTVPSSLTCLMSAIGKEKKTAGDCTTYTFNQPVTIPSYLLAIVVGHIERREISPRCAVWCEPSIVDSAKWEFESTEKILQTAEKLAGPYRWGRFLKYALVVLPPTFPFGGMENPCLTFVTPTLLSGDRSLVNVVAHEISHSWTGNLVTNASWEHFWLNEGFTVFLERKIHGRLQGEPERQFESECGYDEALTTAVKTFGDSHEFTKLIPDERGIDPDDAFSSVPYEKGSAFLFTIEQLLGEPERFEEFLRKYIEKYGKLCT